jgi:hypothetical protein
MKSFVMCTAHRIFVCFNTGGYDGLSMYSVRVKEKFMQGSVGTREKRRLL